MTVVPNPSSETNLAVTPAASVNIDSNAASAATNVAADPGSGSALTIAAGDGVHGLPVLRRNCPGTKASAFCAWAEEDWTEMDSTLAVQQVMSICKSEHTITLFQVNPMLHKLTFLHFILVYSTNYKTGCV